VPFDFGLFVLEQVMLAVGETDETIQPFPVTVITPLGPFTRVTEGSPTSQLVVELGRHLIKNRFGATPFVVIGPAPNDGIELANQSGLRSSAIVTDNLFQVSQVAFDGFLGGSNQGFEINIPLECPGFVSADVILPDVETQKIKPGLTLVFVEGVSDMGFVGIKLQSDMA
jgi:hypothetical protein